MATMRKKKSGSCIAAATEKGPLVLIGDPAVVKKAAKAERIEVARIQVLKDLETQGLIDSEWEAVKSDRAPDEGEGRRRKWYKLSTKGRKRLEQRISAHRTFRRIIDTFIGEPGREETSR